MKTRALLSLGCLLLSACSGGSAPAPANKVLGRFQRAGDCAALKSYVQGYVDRANDFSDRVVPVAEVLPPANPTNTGAPASAEDGGNSPGASTVVQSDFAFAETERGLLHVFSGKNLKILKASPVAEAALIGQFAFDFSPRELVSLKVGAKYYAVVFGGSYDGGVGPMPAIEPGFGPISEDKSVIAVLDLSDPANPQKLLQETAPGRFLEARALVESGKIAWVSERWVPLDDGAANNLPLSDCDGNLLYQNESLNSDYAPYSLTATTISHLDLSLATLPVASQTIWSPAWRTLVAANTEHLLLAQNVDGNDRFDTELYRFDLGGQTPLAFLDGARVPGNILNQFFIDENDGVLRVFHNLNNFAGCFDCVGSGVDGDVPVSDLAPGNYLSTYRNGALIGRSGPFEADEVPFAARFVGRLGCVITFLQIDPLTCFDIQDPAKPLALGELEIEGVSFHLEDLGQGFLLGIGSGSGANGPVVANLFDISDPRHPQLAHQISLSGAADFGWSQAFYDHRALAKDAELRNFAVPIDLSDGSKLALFSVDLVAKKLKAEGELFKPFSESSYDGFLRAYFFSDSLGTLGHTEAEIFSRSDLSSVFTLPLEN